MRKVNVLFLISVFSNGWAWSQTEWDKTREIAESRVEVIRLLIEKKDYDRAVAEAEKLFSMKMPHDKEHLMVESAKHLADALMHDTQYDHALRLLDIAIQGVEQNPHKAKLYKEKGFVCEKKGDRDEALRHFEQSLKLQEKPK